MAQLEQPQLAAQDADEIRCQSISPSGLRCDVGREHDGNHRAIVVWGEPGAINRPPGTAASETLSAAAASETLHTAAAALLATLDTCRCSAPGLWDMGPFEEKETEGEEARGLGGLFCDECKAEHDRLSRESNSRYPQWRQRIYAPEVRTLAAALLADETAGDEGRAA